MIHIQKYLKSRQQNKTTLKTCNMNNLNYDEGFLPLKTLIQNNHNSNNFIITNQDTIKNNHKNLDIRFHQLLNKGKEMNIKNVKKKLLKSDF